MAKKKVTHHQQEKATKSHEKEAPSANVTMEETGEKLESLKSLNAILLKETVERRQQVDSLLHSKGSLESELTRTNSEKEVLRTELAQLKDGAVRVELERDVLDVFVSLQATQRAELMERERNEFRDEKELIERRLQGLEIEMREVLREKWEIEKLKQEREIEIVSLNERVNELVLGIGKAKEVSNEVSRNRDEMKAKLDIQIAEAKKLRGMLDEAEKREKFFQEEVEKLRAEHKLLMEKKEEKEREIESINKDKNQFEKSLAASKKVIEEMKKEIEVIRREKGGINDEKNAQVMKMNELENTVSGLNEVVACLRSEEERLRRYVAELEKSAVEGLQKEKEIIRRIDQLVKEKHESEMRLQKLIEEKVSLEKDLDERLKQLYEHKQKLKQIENEKIQIAGEKLRKEKEVVGLEKQVSELRDAISGIEESSNVQKDQIKNLASEINQYREALELATIERDEARKKFDEEKQNSVSLKQKVTEMEKNIEESVKLVEKIKFEKTKITGEKEELESHCNVLKKEIAALENDLSEARKVLDAMQDKVAAADSSSELLLKALKGTAEFVKSKDEKVASMDRNLDDRDMNGKIEPYVAELEEIKNAFKSKENKVEEMKSQVEFLQNSVAEADKKKTFWTIVSSAATLFAAISLAYVAQGH